MCAQRLSGTATSRVSALLRNGRAALLPPSPGGIAPRWRAGRFPSPVLPSRLPGSRISARAVERAHSSIRMRGLARALIKSQAARRRLPNLRACPRTVINTALGRLPLCSFARPCARSDAAEIASIFQKIVFILLLFDFDYLPPLSPFDFDSLPFIFEIAYYIIFKQ